MSFSGCCFCFVSLILFSLLCFHFRFVFACVSFLGNVLPYRDLCSFFLVVCFCSGMWVSVLACVFLFLVWLFFLFFVFAVVTQFLEKNYYCIVVLSNLENLYTPTAFIFLNLSVSGLTSRCKLWRVGECVLLYSRNLKIQRRDGNENVQKKPIGLVDKRCLTLFL